MAPAIGAAVASQLKTNTLVLFSSMIAATVGANNVFFTKKHQRGHSDKSFAIPAYQVISIYNWTTN